MSDILLEALRELGHEEPIEEALTEKQIEKAAKVLADGKDMVLPPYDDIDEVVEFTDSGVYVCMNSKDYEGDEPENCFNYSLEDFNAAAAVNEGLDEEAEYAIYMFDGESGPSEDDSDPVAIFVASNADEAEEKFQDFVAENSVPHSHVVYRYGKLHEAVEEDEDFWDDDDEKFEEEFEDEE